MAVLTDPQPQVQAVGLVPRVEEQIPERERVLTTRHRDEDSLVGRQHPMVVDRLLHLAPAVLEKVVRAEVRVVATQVDDRRPAADTALHRVTLRRR